MASISVIGSGFSGLSAAACLAQAGNEVTVFEKNDRPGGRARQYSEQGFTFDMGPSWYWMPDVFEKFYQRFGHTTSALYDLRRLDPSYRIFFSAGDIMDVPAGPEALCEMFERREKGSAVKLRKFLEEGKYKYEAGIGRLVYKPGLSFTELLDPVVLSGMFRLHIFRSLSSYVRKFFKDPGLIQLLEFPVLFLGAMPSKTPALYSMMNYADMSLGTWYPMGGYHKVVDSMVNIAAEKGVRFKYNSEILSLDVESGRVNGLNVSSRRHTSDFTIASADYHHVEQNLLPKKYRTYSEHYWQTRTMAPSSLIFYLGINKTLKNLLHHNLFFDKDFGLHSREIYENPSWPTDPLFYVSCPSQTDPSVAPHGMENLFILIPVAAGLADTDRIREKYFDLVISRLESLTRQEIRKHIIVKKSYAYKEFVDDYHAFKGNAYGLANTLKQTANLKPSIVNKKVSNLFYTGQLTLPGPGVPPAIISGQVVADVVDRFVKSRK